MNRVSLATAKSFANIYFTEKDSEVELLVAAAESGVAKFLNYPTLSHEDLLLDQGSPAPDSPGAEVLDPDVEWLVLVEFNSRWQNREKQVIGSIVSDNPEWLRVAHLWRRDLGV